MSNPLLYLKMNIRVALLCLFLPGTIFANTNVNMTPLEAGVLGVVEGLTEYLPVSSTGHLILTQRILGIGTTPDEKVAADAFAICIQLGAILAVLGMYREHFLTILSGFAGKNRPGLLLGRNLILSFLPAAIVGLLFVDQIKTLLFGLWPITIAWFIGGCAILWVERKDRREFRQKEVSLYELSIPEALFIGVIQCIAMWPGVSRSLVTILGGRLVGLTMKSAVVYSFLLGMITLSASTGYDFLTHGKTMIHAFGISNIIIGLVTALLSATMAVKWMVSYLQRKGLAIFGWYRIVIALITGTLLGLSIL